MREVDAMMQELALLRRMIEENRVSVKQSQAAIDWSRQALVFLDKLPQSPVIPLLVPPVIPKPAAR